MVLFSNIFKKDSEGDRSNKGTNIEMKSTIFDFFQIDIRNIPDESFTKGQITYNTAGETVQEYYKSLSYKECNIFDKVEIKIIGETGKNILFKCADVSKIHIQHVETLINELYKIYGLDTGEKGIFTQSDVEDYNDLEFSSLFGRMWSEYPKHKYPVMISKEDHELSITIWGTKQME